MPLLPTISTLFIAISGTLVAIGWVLIARGHRRRHRQVMLSAAISALLFFIIYLTRTILVGNTSFGGPEGVETYYTIYMVFHIILATTGAIFGLVTLRLALKRNIAKHRKLGPVTSVIWFFSAVTGVIVFFLLYIIYEPGETTNVFRAIFGF
ncbi:membrane protein [Thalassobacillus devorans]|uniref:Membrane protein n=1 Tax=Thalassobacillus devorans TaxID=279813 RepID=A0ABQ1NMM1_9BACI|nr:DUF420 domain-containing protein [Thalassobacillus devorans]NIK27776.1 putative membrane protein [Thalassobacillus devorans]GGC80351.1 membrane protein [Thalassobacillus devorans]